MKLLNTISKLVSCIFIVAFFSKCDEPDMFTEDLQSDLTLQMDSAANATIFTPDYSNKSSGLNRRNGRNIASEALISAESTFPGYSAERMVDGSQNTTVGSSHSWTNNQPSGGSLPESVTFFFSSGRTVDLISIYTSTGYVLRDYTIYTQAPGSSSWSTLATVNGNTDVQRIHSFSPMVVRAIKITCRRGPDNQYIYGRLNEVEIYETIAVPSLPNISTINGVLVFNSDEDVAATLDYLEYQYDVYDDAFLAAYGHLSDEVIGDTEESIGHNDEQPYIIFEQQHGISSKRAELSAAEEAYLAATPADSYNPNNNPDNAFFGDDEFRTIVNTQGEVKVGNTFYKFYPDGTYFALSTFSQLLSLRNHKMGEKFPENIPNDIEILGDPVDFIILPPNGQCRLNRKERDDKRNGSWRYDYITSIWNHPWQRRIMAKTKSYKKKNNRWKKRRATISAKVWGTGLKSNNCTHEVFMESSTKQKRRKKVKSKVTTSWRIKAFSGEIESSHTHSKVSSYVNILDW